MGRCLFSLMIFNFESRSYPEGVVFHSPGSRSAPWGGIDPNHLPRRGLIMPQSLHPLFPPRNAAPLTKVMEPLRGTDGAGVFFPQGALRDPGLWHTTPSG